MRILFEKTLFKEDLNLKNTLKELEKRIKYEFNNIDLLLEALIHPSYSHSKFNKKSPSYQRLEFLGDRVVNLAIAEIIYKLYPEKNEGELSIIQASLIRTSSISYVAKNICLGEYILLNNSEKKTDGAKKERNLENTCEAVMGAIFIDSNYDNVSSIIRTLWAPLLESISNDDGDNKDNDDNEDKNIYENRNRNKKNGDNEENGDRNENIKTKILFSKINSKDNKSKLQEWAQKKGYGIPIYTILKKEGVAHSPIFNISVNVCDKTTNGVATTKKMAEQNAAEKMLKILIIK